MFGSNRRCLELLIRIPSNSLMFELKSMESMVMGQIKIKYDLSFSHLSLTIFQSSYRLVILFPPLIVYIAALLLSMSHHAIKEETNYSDEANQRGGRIFKSSF